MTVFAVFSDSRQLVVGPEVALATLAGASLANLAGGDPQRARQLAAMLALMVGALCTLGALIRLGFIAEFLSRPILLGYLMGIALVIISAQLPKMLGFSIHYSLGAKSQVAQFVERPVVGQAVCWIAACALRHLQTNVPRAESTPQGMCPRLCRSSDTTTQRTQSQSPQS